MWDWLSVRDSASVQGSVIYTRPPTAILGHEMEGGRPWAFGISGCTFAAWSRTRAWPKSSGQEQGGVGGRLLEGQVLCGCDMWGCAEPRAGSLFF